MANWGMRTECAQRIPAGKIVTDERLIHKDKSGATLDLALVPGAPSEQRNLQGCEVFRADELHVRVLSLGGDLSQDFDRSGKTAIRRSGIGRYSCPNHAGDLCDFLAKLLEEAAAFGPGCVRIFAQRNDDRHHVLRLIPELHECSCE